MHAMVEKPAPGGKWARRLAPIFHRILDRIDAGLEEGGIDAVLPDGTRRLLGGRRAGPLAIVTLVRWRALRRLITGGSIGWYEAWAAGDISISIFLQVTIPAEFEEDVNFSAASTA